MFLKKHTRTRASITLADAAKSKNILPFKGRIIIIGYYKIYEEARKKDIVE